MHQTIQCEGRFIADQTFQHAALAAAAKAARNTTADSCLAVLALGICHAELAVAANEPVRNIANVLCPTVIAVETSCGGSLVERLQEMPTS